MVFKSIFSGMKNYYMQKLCKILNEKEFLQFESTSINPSLFKDDERQVNFVQEILMIHEAAAL